LRVLIDECLPRRLTKALTGHQAQTVQQAGWSQKTNGDLLHLMQSRFEVLITIDSNLIQQQNLTNLSVALNSRKLRCPDFAPWIGPPMELR